MRNYCLNVDEIAKILRWRECGEPVAYEELSLEIEEAQCWTTRIVCIALFFARVLERKETTIDAKKSRIELLYAMKNEFCFEIQEGDEQFIEYLLRHLRNPDESLEATLIELQNGLSEYRYEKALRY